MQDVIFLFLAGLLGGFLAGYTGVGGGIIYIMILPFVLQKQGIEDHSLAAIIVANSIFGIFVASLISVITHARLKTLFIKEAILISIPAVIVSLSILIFYVNTSAYSYAHFNLFIIILMMSILGMYLINRRKKEEIKSLEGDSSFKYIISGAISGVISSLGGVGGAITLIPLMQHWQKISIKKAKSLSLTMILVMTGILSLNNLLVQTELKNFTGLINFKLLLPMLAGIILTSWYGVKKAHHSSGKNIQIVFITFIILVMINKLYILLH